MFLKERNSESPFQNRLEIRVDIVDGSTTVSPVQVRVNKFTHDRSGADESNLDDEVVKFPRLHDWKSCHLGSRFDLKSANGICTTKQIEGGSVIMGNVCQINGFPPLATDPEAVLHGCEHAKTKEVDFDNPKLFAVILIPLYDSAVWHGRGL